MDKAKLGISVGLLGAALYFMGMISILPLVALAGYVLLREENAWLRRTAVKAVCIYVFFVIISAILGLADNAYSFVSNIFFLFNQTIDLGWYNNILSILHIVVSCIQTLVFLVCGFNALKMRGVKFNTVDRTVDKNM